MAASQKKLDNGKKEDYKKRIEKVYQANVVNIFTADRQWIYLIHMQRGVFMNAMVEMSKYRHEKVLFVNNEKAGLNTIRYTFNEDKTCSYTLKGKLVEGTYEFDAEAKTITIKTGRWGVKTTAHIVTIGNNMSFVFEADKILSVVKTITGAASKFNNSASTINQLAGKFNGMMIGFELKKQ